MPFEISVIDELASLIVERAARPISPCLRASCRSLYRSIYRQGRYGLAGGAILLATDLAVDGGAAIGIEARGIGI